MVFRTNFSGLRYEMSAGLSFLDNSDEFLDDSDENI